MTVLNDRQRFDLDMIRARGKRLQCQSRGCSNLAATRFCDECLAAKAAARRKERRSPQAQRTLT